MLVTQSQTLDLLFNRLTRQATSNMSAGYLQATETYMKLAFRAQSLCRANAEALHEMKNPRPVAFVQQANFAHGPQQVNNGQVPASCAGEIQNSPNELLEHTHGERLDGSATQSATASDMHLAAVGAFDRAKLAGG